MRRLAVVLVVALAFSSRSMADSLVPLVLRETGRLLDASDQPVNGQKQVVFALYDTDNPSTTTPVWSETQTVTFGNGMYSVVLGDTSQGHAGTAISDDVLSQPVLWLSVTIDGAELLPRIRVTSVPYALRAGRAAEAETVLDGGVATAALQDQAVTTPKIADGSVTLAKLDLTNGKFVGLDADTLDGLDSSAFAPSSIVDVLGQPPQGSSISGEIAAIKSTVDAGATASALTSLDGKVGTPASGTVSGDLASISVGIASLNTTLQTGATASALAGLDAKLGTPANSTVSADIAGLGSTLGTDVGQLGTKVDGVGAKVDGVATTASGIVTTIGTPAGASIAADIAALKTQNTSLASQLTALTTQVTALQTELDNRKWKQVTGNLYPNLDTMLAQYPLTDWQWGISYNGYSIVPVTLNNWDGGIRIASIYTYAEGDSVAGLDAGGFVLLKDLPSGESKTCNDQNEFLHFYTLPYQSTNITNGGNGCQDVALYVRRY